MICPRCEGQRYDIGSCQVCGNYGYLTDDGERIESLEQIADAYTTDPAFKQAVDDALGVRVVRVQDSSG